MSLSKPFFSVVIPTYNRAGFIGATLHSVFKQDFTGFEILIVDDGSRDNTAEVVRSFNDSRLRYLPKENAERGAARNYGLDRAGGEYVLFLDSDDLLHPQHLATLHTAITAQQPRPNFIATKYDFDRDGQRRPSDMAPLPAGPLGFDAFLRGNVLACNVCVRRVNPALQRFEEDRRYAAVEDWLFMLENTQHGEPIQLVDAVTLTMNDHDQRSMRADNQCLIRRLELACRLDARAPYPDGRPVPPAAGPGLLPLCHSRLRGRAPPAGLTASPAAPRWGWAAKPRLYCLPAYCWGRG
ncbi:MAG: glycosyltransferase family A protein [Hymenobacter sp.]